MKNTCNKVYLESYHHKDSHSHRHIYILLRQYNQVVLSKTNKAFKGDGHLGKSLKGSSWAQKWQCWWRHSNKRATCQFVQPQKLLTILWVCFLWRRVKIISFSCGIMHTIQLTWFKPTESIATSVSSPGFLSVFSVSIHPWKNRLQGEKRGSHSQVKSKLAEWG